MRVPHHIAIIMDGNGRWATQRHWPRVFGHIRGARRVKPIIEEADRLGVKALTLYAFSTENWNRPVSEISVLWKLFRKHLLREVAALKKRNIRFKVLGEVDKLDPELRNVISSCESILASCTGMWVNVCISYGAQSEILNAARALAQECASGARDAATLSAADLEEKLWTQHLGPEARVDLLIRTGKEKRISNFLLWQAAYAELLFTDSFWPDFKTQDLRAAIEEFSSRERRFGGVEAIKMSDPGSASPVSVAR